MPKKNSKSDWFVFGEWYDLYWFHSPYIYGLYSELKKNVGYTVEKQVWEFHDNVQHAYFSKSQWNNICLRYFNKVKARPEIFANVLKKIEIAADKLFEFNKKIKKVNWSKAQWKQIVAVFSLYHKLHYNLWCLGQVPNLFELNNSLLSNYLNDYLKSKVRSNYFKIEELFQKLTTPLAWSQNQQEEYDFLLLLIKYQNEKNLVRKIKAINDLTKIIKYLKKNYKICWRDLVKHYRKYYWLQYSWTGPALEIDYFVDIFRMRIKDINVFKKAALMKKEKENLSNYKRECFNILNIDKYHQKLFELMTGIVHTKVVRMDALFQSYCYLEPLLKRISAEFNVSLKQLYAIYDGDLVNILRKKKFPENLANQLLEYSVYVSGKGKYKLYVGDKAKKIVKPIIDSLPKPKKVKELRGGECGCPGKAKGIVKLIEVAKDMVKMNKGDVLVSQITNPSLVPAMKKAAAIITDTGGLTCHAAIVAREMNTPCVIGTNIATKVFKDGDNIEVDATNGIIKRI